MTFRRLAAAAALLLALALTVAAFTGTARADDPADESPTSGSPLSTSDNGACLKCHGQRPVDGTITVDGQQMDATIDVNGQQKSIYVDETVMASSPHGQIACISCHIGFNAGTHPATVTDGWLRTAKVNACGDCHGPQASMYKGSFHGKLRLTENDNQAPLCADCHEAHNVLPTTSPDFRKSVVALCTRCHGGHDSTYLDSYHGKAFTLGDQKAAICTDCHPGHKILPASDPASSVSKQNIVKTCGKCHQGANANFASFQVHVNPHNPRSSWLVFLTWLAYISLITVVFGFAAVHTSLYVYRGRREGLYSRPRAPRDRRGQKTIQFHRFNVFHRWMHFLVIVSFTTLVFTGMPLKYKEAPWAQWLMDLFGGVTAAGIYHRIAAIITIFYWGAEMVYMIVTVAMSRGKLLRGPNSMVPRKKDLYDLVGMFSWFVGRGGKPQFDRFVYWEKFDYLSLMVGTVIIGVTGLMMWFPLQTAEFLPGIFLNMALVIHSNEALLAAGVIFIFVHFFSAHLRPESFPIDKVMFTGSIPVHHYQEERPLEYARHVREGTLDEVLVEKAVSGGTLFGDILWWTITGVMGLAALAFTVFVIWSIFY